MCRICVISVRFKLRKQVALWSQSLLTVDLAPSQRYVQGITPLASCSLLLIFLLLPTLLPSTRYQVLTFIHLKNIYQEPLHLLQSP